MKWLWSLQNVSQKRLVIIGLGNPGAQYANTRHNIGFIVADQLASECGLPFKFQRHLQGYLAKGEIEQTGLIILKPETYMNLSGLAVKKLLETLEAVPEEIVVVVDDADLPFGQLKLKAFGSSGGHNGLKSIEAALETVRFARLRVGIGRADRIPLIDFVLMPFSEGEAKELPEVVKKAVEALRQLLKEPIAKVMNSVNVTSKDGEPSPSMPKGQ